jgi:hypothetical protein
VDYYGKGRKSDGLEKKEVWKMERRKRVEKKVKGGDGAKRDCWGRGKGGE